MRSILCYGDSNTYGRDPATKKRFAREIRWPGVLQQRLGGEYQVIEEGLNGRTTVWDDPVRGDRHKRNGALYLVPCLESHAPLDLVVMMLGTNDLKAKFSVTAVDITQSVEALVQLIQASGCGPDGEPPEILLIAPPPLGRLTEYAETFTGGVEKSEKLGGYYRDMAEAHGCRFLDAGSVLTASPRDGLHFDPEGHRKLGERVGEVVTDILER
ncbi:MAG: SGNH/GDSL hydrolase family protein [Spirochaetota bacterium]